jgi:hypothetical protein
MNRILIIIVLVISVFPATAQESTGGKLTVEDEVSLRQAEEPNTKIFPVPVINNRFTVTSDKSFTLIRLTNIIGQETTRVKYNSGRKRAEISFADTQQGIYLVMIEYEDKTRTVKKILVK